MKNQALKLSLIHILYTDEIDASDNIIAATKAKTAAYTAEVCSAASAVAAGAADMSCDAANVRASVVAALELLSTCLLYTSRCVYETDVRPAQLP